MTEEIKNEIPQESNTDKTRPLGRVRTYQDAIAEALRSQEMSSAGMLMAEQKKRDNLQKEREDKTLSSPKNKLLMVISIILIIAAVALIVFAVIKANNRQPADTGSIIKSKYFITEKTIEISSSQLARNTISRIQQASTEPMNNNDIANLVVTKEIKADPNSAFDIKVKSPYTSEDFLALISARAPDNIRKSLDPEFLLGSHKVVQNEKFVLFRVTNYENAFAGMLTWESALARDMEQIFPTEIGRAKITTNEEIIAETVVIDATTSSTTLATSTPLESEPQRTIDNTRVWHDRVIRNTDTRALLDESGRVAFFYALIDNEYIFFGSNESTFAEVMRRVRSAKLIR